MNNLQKVFVSLMVVVILLSSIVAYQTFSLAKANEHFTVDLFVSPFGSNFKLGVNESKTFTARALNGTAPFSYSWKIAPSNGSFQLLVNGELKNFTDSPLFVIDGNSLTFKYPQATSEYVSVQATVIDQQGLSGESHLFVVADPATYPGYKFDGSTADAKYVIRADGTGWFYVTKGLDGGIVSAWTSAVPTTTIEYAMSEGGLVAIADGAYTGASIDVPSDVTLIADPGVTGITYASIADGARIDEPNFNSAFGGYSSGSYTIVTNQSSVATTATWYLAFKPDNSIYFASTNASYTTNSAIDALTVGRTSPESVYLKGTFTLSNSILITCNWTTIFIDGELIADNNLNAPMITNSNPTEALYGVTIEGIGFSILDGNILGQSSLLASGINFTRSSGALPPNLSFPAIHIKNLQIHNCYSQGIYLNFEGTPDGGEVFLENCHIQTNGAYDTVGGYGGAEVVLWNVYDSKIINCYIGGGNTYFGLLMVLCSSVKIEMYYMNGHHKMFNCDRIDFSSTYCDNSGDFDTFALFLVDDIIFHDTIFNYLGSTPNTYNGIKLNGGGASYNCTYNIFSTLLFSGSTSFKYGVEEGDNGEIYNSYDALLGHNVGTGALRTISAGVKYDEDSIVGAIVLS